MGFIEQLQSALGITPSGPPPGAQGAPGTQSGPVANGPDGGPPQLPPAPPVQTAGVQGGPGAQSGAGSPPGGGQGSPVKQFISDMAQKVQSAGPGAVAGAMPVPGAPILAQAPGLMSALGGGSAPAAAAPPPPPAQGAGPGGPPDPSQQPLTPPPGTTVGMPQGGPTQPVMQRLQQAIAAAKVQRDVNGGQPPPAAGGAQPPGNMNATPLSAPAPAAAPAAAPVSGLQTPFGVITGQDVKDYLHRVALGAGAGVAPGDRSGGAAFLRGVTGGAKAGDDADAATAKGAQQKFTNDLATKKDARETKSAGYKNAEILANTLAKLNPGNDRAVNARVSTALTNYATELGQNGITGEKARSLLNARARNMVGDDSWAVPSDADLTAPKSAAKAQAAAGTQQSAAALSGMQDNAAPAAAPAPAAAKGPKGSLGPAAGHPEGATMVGNAGTKYAGQKFVVRGGYWVPAQ